MMNEIKSGQRTKRTRSYTWDPASSGPMTKKSSFTKPKRDREHFRSALVNIIL